MTEYRVTLTSGEARTIHAATVNLGMRKLWFYDDKNHLTALYRWDHLAGFEVVGSADQQVFTEVLLHEARPATPVEREQAIEEKGLMRVLLEECVTILNRAHEQLRHTWVKVDDENKKKSEIKLLVQQQEGALRSLQARLIDGGESMQRVLGLLQTEFRDMGLTTKPVPEEKQLTEVMREITDRGEKKRKSFFS